MLSNYPPGVSGREYQISGPDWESELHHYCNQCDAFVDGTVEEFSGIVTFWHDIGNSLIHEIDVTAEWCPDNEGLFGPDPF